MHIDPKQSPVPVHQRIEILQRNMRKIGGIPLNYTALQFIYFDTTMKIKNIQKSLIGLYGTDNLMKFIFERNYQSLFDKTSKGAVSLDKDSRNNARLQNPPQDLLTFLDLYDMWKELDGMIKLIPKLMEMRPTGEYTENGDEIIRVFPTITPQNTGRVGYSEPPIQNFPRAIADQLIVAPKGYKIIKYDSSQIEPRIYCGLYLQDPTIMSLIKMYDDAYYGLYHYAMSSDTTTRLNISKENRDLMKRVFNAVTYGSSGGEGLEFKKRIIEKFKKIPRRQQQLKEIEDKIARQDLLVHSFFGTPIDLSQSKSYQLNTNKRSLMNAALNNPIQATAGDLMGFSLQASDELLEDYGMCGILAFKHDEGIYLVKDEYYDELNEKLKDHTRYDIGGLVSISND